MIAPQTCNRVAVFVGTRADLGPLSPVLAALDGASDIELSVLTGVSFTARDLVGLLPPSETSWTGRVHAVATVMHEVTNTRIVEHGASISAGTTIALESLDPQVLIVLGDRWELLYVVPPAYLLGVPIVHIHGGEITDGAIDERIRHAISKLADQHCVASANAAARLRQMGEPPERVHQTGAPGLDSLINVDAIGDADLSSLLQIDVTRPVALFTYHPPTSQSGAPAGEWARAAAEATLEVCGTVIGTYPGMDAGRDEIVQSLGELAEEEPRFHFSSALGRNYPRVLRSVDIVVGNSSSGIIEAATYHLPAINVGGRQNGRLRGENVIDVAEGRDEVRRGVVEGLTASFIARCALVENPYGTGEASERILDVARNSCAFPRSKPFVDLVGGHE